MRTITLLALLTAALAIPATGATAPADQVKGPACGDITLWDDVQAGPPAYSNFTGTPTVFASITTAKPSCDSLTYQFDVYNASGTTLLSSQSFPGDGSTSEFQFTYSPPGGPNQVCVSASSLRGDKVVDAAPNSGCFVADLGSSGGQSGLN